MLGSTVYTDQLAAFQQKGALELPSQRGVDVYGTYVMPCRGFGLLTDPRDGQDGMPIAIAPRGRDLLPPRAAMPRYEAIRDLLLEGGILTREHLRIAGPHFSVNGLANDSIERDTLLRSMFERYRDTPDVVKSYKNFKMTTRWAAGRIGSGAMSAADIIASNLAQVGLSSNGCGWVEARSAGRRGVLAARVASELTAHGVHLTGGGRGAPWPGVGRSGVAAGRPACQRATRVLRLSVYHWLEWALGWPIPAAPLASQASQTPLGGRWSDRVLRGPSRVVAQFGRHRLPKSWMDTRASRLA